jgi:hypothetical protein
VTTPSVIAKIFIMRVERARDDKERAGESTSPNISYMSHTSQRTPRQAGNKIFQDTYTIDVDKAEASLTLRSDVTPDHES